MSTKATLSPEVIVGRAQDAAQYLTMKSVDVIVTSPPYWQKRNYGHEEQFGWEKTPRQFAAALIDIMESWRPILKENSSVFINLGDSIRNGKMVGVTTLFEVEAIARGWNLISRIVWAKRNGMPNPHGRLAQRHEFIFHFAAGNSTYTDTYAYSQTFDLSEGDIWHIESRPSRTPHLAPFPEELPQRAILLACPEQVCSGCGVPIERVLKRSLNLNPDRPQARRALELWEQHGLSEQHLEAIRATGICDAGKSLQFQTGAGRNGAQTTRLALEAKQCLGGYFREFTFALPEQSGWDACTCGGKARRPGLVLDPFMGSGTTLRAAQALNRRSVGIDLKPMMDNPAR